jgi:L-tyrosine isonitrile synthase
MTTGDQTIISPSRKTIAEPAEADGIERIVKSFNTWAFKREQPTPPGGLHDAVATARRKRVPIRLVLYWGKGPRDLPGPPETQCFAYLAQCRSRIAAAHNEGVLITLILTDTHARLNGHSEQQIVQYFSRINRSASEIGFETCLLSDIVDRYGSTSDGDLHPDPQLLTALRESAAKWYGGDLDPTEAALRYYGMNMTERRAVEQAFPESIFVTFNSSKMRPLFPDSLPIFYMYSMKKGVAVKPWFVAFEDESLAQSD